MTRTPEAENLIGWLPICVRAPGLSDWSRKFCASIIARNRRGGFVPTEAQLVVMRDIVGKVRAQALGEVVE
jgi:hypothetical protein